MELVPSRRSPPKSSMLSGLAATMKGKAASMQEDAKGKVSYAAMSCVCTRRSVGCGDQVPFVETNVGL